MQSINSSVAVYTHGLSDPDVIQQAFVALSMQHCYHDLCMFRMRPSLLFKTYLAFGTLPTRLASRNARTAATAQRQPVNARRQLQQRRVFCAITRPKNEHIRAMDRFMAQGAGGSWRPRHGRGRSTQARKHASTQAHTAHKACASTPVPRKAPHPAHTATRMCPKNTHALDRSVYQSCPGNLHNKHTSTHSCASTPVPQIPHPAHTATRMCPKNTHKSTCAGSGPMRTALCCFHRAHRNTMRGSYTGAGIHGHWPAPKTSRKPTPACMHKHGKSARVRWPRVPIEAVCVRIPGIE